MSQLAEMGVAIPDEFRGDMALAGEWKVVSERVIEEDETKPKDASAVGAVGVRKRKHNEADGDEDEEDKREFNHSHLTSKGWGSAMKQYPDPNTRDDEDLDALLESTKEIKKVKPSSSSESHTNLSAKPEKDETLQQKTDEALLPKKEEQEEDPQSNATPSAAPASTVKKEPNEAAPGIVFKKRKPKAMRK